MGKITDIANKPILINELFELLPLGVVVIDDGGHLHMVNEKTVKMFDYAKSEIIGQPLEILLPEYLQSAHIDHRKQFFSAPQTRTMGIGLDLVGRKKMVVNFLLKSVLVLLNRVGEPSQLVLLVILVSENKPQKPCSKVRAVIIAL